MVVKTMRWSPWPAVSSRKFEASITVRKMLGIKKEAEKRRFWVEIKWKGENKIGLRNLRRSSFKRNITREGGFCGDGVFEWNEEFKTVCNLSGSNPWEIVFTVMAGLSQDQGNTFLVGTATLNLAEFASVAIEKELEMNLPLSIPCKTTDDVPMLCLCLGLMELGTVQESLQAVSGSVHPVPLSPSSEEALSPARKDERSGLKAGLRKVRLFRRTTKAFHDESLRSEDTESSSPFDTDSLDDDADGSSEDTTRDINGQLSVNYESLAYVNLARGSLYSSTVPDAEGEDWVYYSKCKADMTPYQVGYLNATVCEQPLKGSSKQLFLAWRKRKLSFKTSKSKVTGEPLLKKDYAETGGDDIDFDRRQLSSSDESSGWSKSEEDSTTGRSSVSNFGDDNFAVGCWEKKEVISRDGHMKLQVQVFFASIDQRNERAAGESACTALVAVIASWLQSNQHEVPIKSEFDNLIRDGSLEWRKLCENEEYQQRFPDKHFDLETVLQTEVRPLSVVPEKSFVGFFHPEGLEGDFDFLHEAMSFDSIWEEISRNGPGLSNNGEPLAYIISWNDHFFVLRVEADAYYIIDTLGERLYEGCNQAYILKFDKDTSISRLPEGPKESDKGSSNNKVQSSKRKTGQAKLKKEGMSEVKEEMVCKGKESCKEYIKSFLAAIPVREMQADIKKGLMAASTPIHQRLQIEFHYTQLMTHSASEW